MMEKARAGTAKWLLSLGLAVCVAAAWAHETHPGETAFAREVAARHGLSEQRVLATLDQAQKQQSVLDAMQRPAESMQWKDYRPIFMTPARIAGGVAFYRGNRELLERIADKYGVDPQYVVAILGVETSYGVRTGKYRVIDALATLAFYYPPRQSYFRGELEKLLAMPEDQLPAPLTELMGSYAGAMGWGQFMPSSIAAYARDEDGDGRIDLMNSLPDILGSVANYLAGNGWKRGEPVAVQAQAEQDARPVQTDRSKTMYDVAELESRGYAPLTRVDASRPATLLQLQGDHGDEYWLTFGNFQVITRYNRSPLYAMAVQQLAEAIVAGATDTTSASR
jgi:membrane-bound lytic murein transglycosylase B